MKRCISSPFRALTVGVGHAPWERLRCTQLQLQTFHSQTSSSLVFFVHLCLPMLFATLLPHIVQVTSPSVVTACVGVFNERMRGSSVTSNGPAAPTSWVSGALAGGMGCCRRRRCNGRARDHRRCVVCVKTMDRRRRSICSGRRVVCVKAMDRRRRSVCIGRRVVFVKVLDRGLAEERSLRVHD